MAERKSDEEQNPGPRAIEQAQAARPDGEAVCRVCGSPELEAFFHLEQVPVLANRLWPDAHSAQSAPMGELHLVFCRRCGYVANQSFDPARMVYDPGYENSLHFSERYSQYAQETAQRLVDQYGLRDKDVIEIGSGKGEFLSLLCRLGENRGLGFDPSHEPGLVDELDGQVRFMKDLYTEQYDHLPADLVASRHVLEHLPEPRRLLDSLRRTLGSRPESVLFFEVPNVLYTLRDMGVWDLIYEHVSYFSPGSLRAAFCLSGFEVLEVNETYGGQFLTLDARPGENGPEKLGPAVLENAQQVGRLAQAFAENDRQKWQAWRTRLEDFRSRGQKVVVWGGGSKGVSFLNRYREVSPVEWVVDINPRKTGKFIPGTGQQIVTPEFLRSYPPDVVLVMNPLYLDEIREMAVYYGTNPEFFQV